MILVYPLLPVGQLLYELLGLILHAFKDLFLIQQDGYFLLRFRLFFPLNFELFDEEQQGSQALYTAYDDV